MIKGLISVIVPVYNVKEYLRCCIDSILKQTYDKLELIIVDDGSTDGSGEICEEFKDRDVRIRIFHKKNGGASSARNLGLKYANGEYIGFVDSDDFIKADMYESMLKHMERNVDIVCCGTAVIYPDRMKRNSSAYCNPSKVTVLEGENAIREMLLLGKLCFSSCDKLFRRELFEEILYPEGRTCEDLPVVYGLVKKSRSIINIGEVKYFYRYRDSSISRCEFSMPRVFYVLYARDILLDVREQFPELRKEAQAMYIRHLCIILVQIRECSNREAYKQELNRLERALKKMFFYGLMNPYVTKQQRLLMGKILWKKEYLHK